MNPWRNFHNDFNALKEAEDGIARERVPVAHCYAYVTYSESGEVGCWVEDVPSESLGARFALAASGAGLALGCPQGTPPIDYLLSRLVLDLRENGSEHLMDLGAACFIHRVYEALATYFLRLELKALENTNPSAESERFGAIRPTRASRVRLGGWKSRSYLGLYATLGLLRGRVGQTSCGRPSRSK
jgi:hypothetical protein